MMVMVPNDDVSMPRKSETDEWRELRQANQPFFEKNKNNQVEKHTTRRRYYLCC